MKITILGHSDKRHIIYTMLRMLKYSGRVCLITNNPQYRQLSIDFEDDFLISDVQVLIAEDPDEVADYHELDGYDYIIYDCLLSIPEEMDVVIIMDHVKTYETFMDEHDIPDIPTYVPKDAEVGKGNYTKVPFIPASLVEPQLRAIENSYKLLPINNSTHNKCMSSLLSGITKIPAAKLMATLKQKGDDVK